MGTLDVLRYWEVVLRVYITCAYDSIQLAVVGVFTRGLKAMSMYGELQGSAQPPGESCS